MGAPQALPPTPPAAELREVIDFSPVGAVGKSMRGTRQVGQSPLPAIPPGVLGLDPRGTATSPSAIPLSPLASTPPSEDLAGSPTETRGAHGAPCTPTETRGAYGAPCTPPAALGVLPHGGGQFPAPGSASLPGHLP